MRVGWYWIGTLLLVCQGLSGQVNVKIETDTSHYLVGDDIVVSASIYPADPGMEIIDGMHLVDSFSNLSLLESKKWQYINNQYVNEFIVGAYDTGAQMIIMPVTMRKGDQADSTLSNPAQFYIQGIEIDSTGLTPIKDIIEEPLKLSDFIHIILALVGIVLLVLIIVYLIRRKKRDQTAPVEPEVYIPPDQLALDKLEELKKAQLWQQGKVKEYQSQLTYILREYLENAFPVNALEQTTSETLRAVGQLRYMSSEDIRSLSDMLNMADLVKFAKGIPPADLHAKFMEQAESFVIKTYAAKKATYASDQNEEE